MTADEAICHHPLIGFPSAGEPYGTMPSPPVPFPHMRNAILHDDAHLKLALFGANCSSGRTYTNAPERWDPSWQNNVALARLADAAGIEAMIPIARWKGYGGDTNPNG